MILIRTIHREIEGDFTDPVLVWQQFLEHINRSLKGVTVLGTIKHDFPGGGMSGIVLLGESHAAIHTWPEHGKAWVELATCGDPEDLSRFVEYYDKRYQTSV